MGVLDRVMRVLLEGGFESRLHAVFGGRLVSVKERSKQWWHKEWRKEEERDEKEHLQPEGLVEHW